MATTIWVYVGVLKIPFYLVTSLGTDKYTSIGICIVADMYQWYMYNYY